MPHLEIQVKRKTWTVPFPGDEIAIGRGADNDVVIDDAKASRRHCVISHAKGTFRVRDLDSHNGTWMGQDRVSEAIMALGDAIRIGQTEIRLLPDEVEEHAAPLPVARVVIEERPEGGEVAEEVVEGDAAVVVEMPSGPLAAQLAPLLKACGEVPLPAYAPPSYTQVSLLNRKGEVIGEPPQGKKAKPAPALDSFRQLLYAGLRSRSTDIHCEPKEGLYSLRFRIDGLLTPVGQIAEALAAAIINVTKVLCQLDIAKHHIVQEGSFAIEVPDRRIDLRVSITPTSHGEKLALRFLDKAAVPEHFENLGMELDAVAEFKRICNQNSGLVVLSGPTGSGKTTTLYTALRHIDSRTRNIVTIEDPVEYELPNASQISIDPLHKLTFASVLASVLRQDPDVLLVGEIRDPETAQLAMQAAMTGHLVLTTLHARDTAGTIFRLLDLGVEPFMIANAMSACVSQRLIRVLCPDCRQPYKPPAEMIRRMKLEDRPHGSFFTAVGCRRCMDSGYRGRMALYELLMFDNRLRDVVLTKPTIADIRRAAGQWMFRTLEDSGYRKVVEGVTTLEEIERVVGAS